MKALRIARVVWIGLSVVHTTLVAGYFGYEALMVRNYIRKRERGLLK